MSGALRECPFCGGDASSDGSIRYSPHYDAEWADGTPVREAFFVNCVKCGNTNQGMTGHQTRALAITAWNTRTDTNSDLLGALEALERQVVALYRAAIPHGNYGANAVQSARNENTFADNDDVVQLARTAIAKYRALIEEQG